MTRLLLAFLLVPLGGCGLVTAVGVDVLGYDEVALPDANVRPDLAYLGTGLDKHRLDLFLPLADSVRARPWPVVLFVHGGGWTEGDRAFRFGGEDFYGNVGRALARRGVGTAVISYRLIPEADWRAQVADVAAALAFVQDTVSAFGGDPASIVMMGHSAGAQLSLRVTYDLAVREAAGAEPVCGVVSVSGAALDLVDPATWATDTDFAFYAARFSPSRERLDGPPETPFAWQTEASPVTYTSSDDPPTLIVYAPGEADLFRTQAEALSRALAEVGVWQRIETMPALNHEVGVLNLSHPDRVVVPETLRFLRERGC